MLVGVFPIQDHHMNWMLLQINLLLVLVVALTLVIAKRMGCSTAGVRWNFQEMISKTGYSCKEDLIAAALESKLLVTTLK